MANLSKCRRCGADIHPKPRATVQKFCGKDCYDTWWSEFRSVGRTRGEWMENRYGPANKVDLSETERVWLAAFVDGEGTIGIYRSTRKGNRSGFRYQAVCSVANTNLALIERFAWLADTRVVRKSKNGTRCKDIYTVSVKGRALENFLRQIRPHLIAKVEQADLVLDFLSHLALAPMRSSSYHDVFDEFYQKTRQLNRKGRETFASL